MYLHCFAIFSGTCKFGPTLTVLQLRLGRPAFTTVLTVGWPRVKAQPAWLETFEKGFHSAGGPWAFRLMGCCRNMTRTRTKLGKPKWCLKKDFWVCLTKVLLIWTNLSCCTSVNLRKPLPDVFWDDDEWISQCMRKDNQARSYIFKMKLSTSNFWLPINLQTCNNRKDQENKRRALLYHYPCWRLTSLPSTTFSSPISGSSFWLEKKANELKGNMERGWRGWQLFSVSYFHPDLQKISNFCMHNDTSELFKQNWAVSQTDRLQIRYMAVWGTTMFFHKDGTARA